MKTILREHKNSALGLLFSIIVSIAFALSLPSIFHHAAHPINIMIGFSIIFFFTFLVLRKLLWSRTLRKIQLLGIPDASLYELEHERKVNASGATEDDSVHRIAERQLPLGRPSRLTVVASSEAVKVASIASIKKEQENARCATTLKEARENLREFFLRNPSLTFADSEAKALLFIYITSLYQRLSMLGITNIHEDASMKSALTLQDHPSTRKLPPIFPKYLDADYKLPVAQLVK